MKRADRLYIGEVAMELGRVPHTLRERRSKREPDFFPAKLRARKDERGWRYWTPEQVDGLKRWLVEANITPGKNLPSVLRKSGKLA